MEEYDLAHAMLDEPYTSIRLAARNYREADEEDADKAFQELAYQIARLMMLVRKADKL